jgi:hypothetical protein
MLNELTAWNGDPTLSFEGRGVVAICDPRSLQPLRSGQTFEVRRNNKDDAEKMKDMVDLQWYLVLAWNLAGAEETPEEFENGSDDDFDLNTMQGSE